MTKGKYADRAKNRRIEELESQKRDLESKLAKERKSHHRDNEAHAEELRRQRVNAARTGAHLVHQKMIENLDDIANGFCAMTWKAQRIAMTEAIAHLFFAGYLDWDRVEGDVAVLRFLKAHGDLDTWFYLVDKIGHGHSRAVLRQNRKQNGAITALLIEKDVEKIRLGVDEAAEQAEKDRLALDAVVEKARNAFINASADELNLELDPEDAPTEEEREIHKLAMESVEKFVKKFGNAK